ncbi:MAG TPA: L,D-transpeptidase/peptidoglycan binding protein [Solirubrobacterales bacterium]|nr:L,D-transpeptidase/peptidoglycan binding protein [Solirubrobacterales bacterium]
MRARLNRSHKVAIAVVALVTLGLLLAVGVWAYDDAQKDQIAPGVKIGGVDVGGRDADSARRIIKREVVAPLRQPVVVTYDGKSYTLSASQLHPTADIDGMVQEAIDKSREGTIFDRVGRYASGGGVNVNLPTRVKYDKKAVKDFVNQLAEQINVDPVDATVVPGGSRLEKRRGEAGRAVEKAQMTDAINQAARSPGRDQPVEAVVKTTKPEVTTKDLADAYPRYIYINRGAFRLSFYSHLKLVKSYPIAVGQQGLETPAGLYHAQDKQVNPSWHVPNSAWAGSLAGQVIPPGPSNPLQARWIGIFDGAGIHGTSDIGSLGSAASHGCVRMSVPDVIDLYDRVQVGDPIYVQ